MKNERAVTGMAEYIDRGLFLKNVKHNAPYIYSMVAPIALITPAADVAPVRRWIPAAERLPEKNKEVVGWYKDNPFSPFRYGVVSWNGHGWVFTYAQRYVDAVTYWMPLPEPPKEETP